MQISQRFNRALLLFTTLLLFSSACQKNLQQEKMSAFLQLFPNTEFDGRIILKDWTIEELSGGDIFIDLWLQNESSERISLEIEDIHCKLYFYSNSENAWREVLNREIDNGKGIILVPKENTQMSALFSGIPVSAQLNPFELKETNIVRVVVVGTVMDGEIKTDKKVGAFIDIHVADQYFHQN